MANLIPPPLPENDDVTLYRHVHPKWLDNGEPSSMAFRPFDESNIHLSVDLSTKTSAEAAHKNFKGESVGVFGVTPAECSAEELKTYWAPEAGNDAHGAIDYTETGLGKAAKKKSSRLAAKARARRRLYPPPDDLPTTATDEGATATVQPSAEATPTGDMPPPTAEQPRRGDEPST
ncbi:hypothetical protein JRI60_09145 [Archangium violaceum]|uniref:hypothetical protein n=1 Tax=Archangium violaceum TaxID=83451 RepID=UPI001951768F|nr:hypothetical protein [Archangium violaceum]QRN99163.1 hypothetical protein JRI60_09145 [Archangium violaceum]